MYACMHVGMRAYVYACMHAWMSVCLYVCMDACMSKTTYLYEVLMEAKTYIYNIDMLTYYISSISVYSCL